MLACVVLWSCDDVDENGGKGAEGEGQELRVTSTRLEKSSAGSGRLKSTVPGMEDRLVELRAMKDTNLKKERFAEILLDLPSEEHDVAVELVVDDLSSDNPANLVLEYLELSSLMSPALQLPGIVRLLEEPSLPLLQRAAMEHQLRQDLNLTDDLKIVDWRPLVETHLLERATLITE